MLKSDLIELRDSLDFSLKFIKTRLEIASEIEKPTLDILLPEIQKAYEIAKLTAELK